MNAVTSFSARRRASGYMLSATTEEVTAEGKRRPRRIPLAEVPLFPIARMANFLPKYRHDYPSVIDSGEPWFLEYGRQAIFAALAWQGVGQGDRVLVPAYHCQAMVDPVTALGAEPIFFRVTNSLEVDMDDFTVKSPGAKAALAVHYFGFASRLDDLAELCRRAGIFLIEDCAHAYFGELNGQPPGSLGDVAVASPRKFFPSARGGLLIVPEGSKSDITPQRPGVRQEISAVVEIVRRATRYGGLPLLKPLVRLVDGSSANELAIAGDEGTDQAVPEEQANLLLPQRGFVVDRVLARHDDAGKIAEVRRRNYCRLLEPLRELEAVEPVFDELPDGCVPFVLPLRIKGLAEIFPAFEDAALPMQRFGQFPSALMPRDTCGTTSELAACGLQLSCHQSLTDEDIDWIAGRLRDCLDRAAKRACA